MGHLLLHVLPFELSFFCVPKFGQYPDPLKQKLSVSEFVRANPLPRKLATVSPVSRVNIRKSAFEQSLQCSAVESST